jgi:hypothetical protein
MKSSFRITALATLVAAFASLAPAMHAQTKLTQSVSVPFPFNYGTKHFEPGVYTIREDSPNLLTVLSPNGGAMAIVQSDSEPILRSGEKVIFHKYGDRYFLAEVLLADRGNRITVLESNAEKHAEREYREQIKNGLTPTQVALVLLPPRPLGN